VDHVHHFDPGSKTDAGRLLVSAPSSRIIMNTINAIHIPQVLPCPDAGALNNGYVSCAKTNRRAILLITVLGSSLAFMDGSIVNVALPTLQKAFQTSASVVQWVIQSYALFCASLLLFAGALGDRFGRKRIFTVGITFFAVSSLGAAAADSLWLLIGWRSLQGIGAALLIPQSLAILSAAYPGDERAAAFGAWSAWTSAFSALGPVLGGWLIELLNWRWAFAINLPMAFWIVVLLPKLHESESEVSMESLRKLDFRGTILDTTGLAALVYALSLAAQIGSGERNVSWIFFLGVILIVAFLVTQARNENALMPLSLFSNPRFRAVSVLTFLYYGALGGAFYVVPFFAMQIKHLNPVATGAAFLPGIACMFLFASRIGQLSSKYGERPFLIIGSFATAIGLALFGVFAQRTGYTAALLPGMLGLGVGITIALAPLTNVVMVSVPQDKSSLASAVNNSISRLAGLVALSGLILVLSKSFDQSLLMRLRTSGLSEAVQTTLYSERALMTAMEIPSKLTPQQKNAAQDAIEDSYTSAYTLVMYCCAAGAFLSAFPVLFWWDEAHERKHSSIARTDLSRQKGQQLSH
jgi:EmrB/QacA subfamily drug resistance transporter